MCVTVKGEKNKSGETELDRGSGVGCNDLIGGVYFLSDCGSTWLAGRHMGRPSYLETRRSVRTSRDGVARTGQQVGQTSLRAGLSGGSTQMSGSRVSLFQLEMGSGREGSNTLMCIARKVDISTHARPVRPPTFLSPPLSGPRESDHLKGTLSRPCSLLVVADVKIHVSVDQNHTGVLRALKAGYEQ